MRIRIITAIIFVLFLCGSLASAATEGQIVAQGDQHFKEWSLSGGNRFGDYVELSSVRQDGNKYSCYVASINRKTRAIFSIREETIIEISSDKIMFSSRDKVIDTKSNDYFDKAAVQLYQIMKNTLSNRKEVAKSGESKSVGMLSKEHFKLGNISMGASPKEITKKYGKPSRVDDHNGMTYYYGDKLSFSFRGVGATTLYDITTTAKDGIKTADGVRVGMLVNSLYDKYGPPNTKTVDAERTHYHYCWEGDKYLYFTFTARNGVIEKISLHYSE